MFFLRECVTVRACMRICVCVWVRVCACVCVCACVRMEGRKNYILANTPGLFANVVCSECLPPVHNNY